MVAGVVFPADDMWTSRPIHMNHGRTILLHLWEYIIGHGHESSGFLIQIPAFEVLSRIFFQDAGSKGHELGSLQPLVEPVIDGPVAGTCDDAAVSKRPGTVFHTSGETAYNLSVSQVPGDFLFDSITLPPRQSCTVQ